MRYVWFVLLAAAVGVTALPAPAAAQWEEPWLQIDWGFDEGDGDGTKENPYEVPSDMPIPIIACVGWEDHEYEAVFIDEVSIEIWHEGGGDTEWTWEWEAESGQIACVCEWFDWGVLTLHGEPCNTVGIQADLWLTDCDGRPYGPLYSNELYFHVVPEPAAFTSLAGLLLGVAGWFRLRKR